MKLAEVEKTKRTGERRAHDQRRHDRVARRHALDEEVREEHHEHERGLDLRRVEHLLGYKLSGDDSFSTLAGYVLQSLGRLPSVGDAFASEGLRFEVVAMDGARIERLKVTPEE